ncbi:hypothetical protein ABPG72_002738 [Tetrahymena utriculariae]
MRNFNETKFLWTAGGIAASIGALFYLYKKKKRELNDPINILRICMNRFYYSPQNQFINMSKRFNKIIDFFIGSHILKINQKDEELSHLSYCKNKIQSEGFYECLTCDHDNTGPKQPNIEVNHVFSVNQFCSDCFDRTFHKDHQFRKRQYNGNINCDCGNENRIPKESFCKNHNGLKLQQGKKKNQDYQIMKRQFIDLFKEAFYILIDKQTDFIYEAQKGNFDKNKQNHFNYLLTVIIEKILQLVSESILLIEVVSELLCSPLGRALQIDTSKTSNLCFLKGKEINERTSVFEYLIMLYPYVSEKNDDLIFSLLSDLTVASYSFNEFFTEKLLKLIKFCLHLKQESNNKHIYQAQIFQLCLKGLQTLNISKWIIQNDANTYIQSLKYVSHIIKNISFIKASEYRLIYTISVILSQIVQIVSIFQSSFQVVVEYSVELVKLHSLIYDKLILKNLDTDEDYTRQFLQKYPLIFGFFEIQKILLNYFKLLVINILKCNTKKQIDLLTHSICFQFEQQIYRIYEISNYFKDEKDEELLHTSICLFPIIIYIILLKSNSLDFSLENIKSTLEDSFSFLEKSQYNNLFQMMLALMKNNILQCYEYPNSYWRWYLEIIFQQNADCQIILDSVNNWISTENKLYDHFMLTYQILYLLVEDQEQNLLSPLIQKFIEKPKQLEESETDFTFTESYYLQIFLNQCIFDQTPFLNITNQFSQSKIINSLNESEKIKIDLAVENSVKQISLFYKDEIGYLSELKNYVRRYFWIEDQNLDKYLENVFSINKETDKFYLKTKQNQINYFNLGRSFCSMNNFQSDQLVIFQGSIRNELLDNLFEFQQQLLIKFFSDSWQLKQFIQRIELEAINDNFSSIIQYLHSFILVFDYIISLSANKPQLFNKKQLGQAQIIQQTLYNKDNFDMIIKAMQKVISNLSGEEGNKQQIQLITQTLNDYQNQFNKQSQIAKVSEQPKQNLIEDSTENVQEANNQKLPENVFANDQYLLSISESNLINSQNNQTQENQIQ